MTSTTLVVVEVGLSHSAHFNITFMCHRASRAPCAVVEPIATMRVQNYVGSRVKSGSCWKCSSGSHLLFVEQKECRTTFQLTQECHVDLSAITEPLVEFRTPYKALMMLTLFTHTQIGELIPVGINWALTEISAFYCIAFPLSETTTLEINACNLSQFVKFS